MSAILKNIDRLSSSELKEIYRKQQFRDLDSISITVTPENLGRYARSIALENSLNVVKEESERDLQRVENKAKQQIELTQLQAQDEIQSIQTKLSKTEEQSAKTISFLNTGLSHYKTIATELNKVKPNPYLGHKYVVEHDGEPLILTQNEDDLRTHLISLLQKNDLPTELFLTKFAKFLDSKGSQSLLDRLGGIINGTLHPENVLDNLDISKLVKKYGEYKELENISKFKGIYTIQLGKYRISRLLENTGKDAVKHNKRQTHTSKKAGK